MIGIHHVLGQHFIDRDGFGEHSLNKHDYLMIYNLQTACEPAHGLGENDLHWLCQKILLLECPSQFFERLAATVNCN